MVNVSRCVTTANLGGFGPHFERNDMTSFISPFDVRDNVKHYGKAYAFYEARQYVGSVKAMYLLWVAIHMLRYDEVKYT